MRKWGTGSPGSTGANWAVAVPSKWLAPESILNFQRENNLNMEEFKNYVKQRVRHMMQKGRPQKLIELLRSPDLQKFTEKDYRKEISMFVPYDTKQLATDLLAHMTMQIDILKSIMSN